MSIMQRVRQAIGQWHDAIEQTDFAMSLMDGRITSSGYAVYLTEMWHIHTALENAIINCTSAQPYFDQSMRRTNAIQHDATAIGHVIADRPVFAQTELICSQIDGWAQSSPHALVGCIYILEGSRMGSLLIGKALKKTLSMVPGVEHSANAGVEYHLDGAAETPHRVKQFKMRVDTAGLASSQEQELTLGACVFMQMLLDLYRVLPVNHAPIASASRCPFMHQHVGRTTQSEMLADPLSPSANLRSA